MSDKKKTFWERVSEITKGRDSEAVVIYKFEGRGVDSRGLG